MPSEVIHRVPVYIAARRTPNVIKFRPHRWPLNVGLPLIYTYVSHEHPCRTVWRLALNDPVRVLIHSAENYTLDCRVFCLLIVNDLPQ
jgi:hypothetical protein